MFMFFRADLLTFKNNNSYYCYQVHGGALIYANNTSLVLEPPSDTQKQYAKMGEIERSRLNEREKHLLKLRQEKLGKKEEGEVKMEDVEKGNDVAADDSSLPTRQTKGAKRKQNPLGVADRPVFKRKRVKVLQISGLLSSTIFRVSLN